MSICRWADDCDVYIYDSRDGLICCECTLPDYDTLAEAVFQTPAEMLEHLQQHVKAGHKVPPSVLDEMRRRIANAIEEREGELEG